MMRADVVLIMPAFLDAQGQGRTYIAAAKGASRWPTRDFRGTLVKARMLSSGGNRGPSRGKRMRKEFEGNEDWTARDEGRVPSKGAMAAQRASAGLGATDHDAEIQSELLSLEAFRVKRILRGRPQATQ